MVSELPIACQEISACARPPPSLPLSLSPLYPSYCHQLLSLKITPLFKSLQRIPVIHRMKSRFLRTPFNPFHGLVSIYPLGFPKNELFDVPQNT